MPKLLSRVSSRCAKEVWKPAEFVAIQKPCDSGDILPILPSMTSLTCSFHSRRECSRLAWNQKRHLKRHEIVDCRVDFPTALHSKMEKCDRRLGRQILFPSRYPI